MANYILLVDDNDSSLTMASFLIEKADSIPVQVKDGFSAIDKLEDHPWRLIIVDLQMPKMSGIELIKRIRGNEKTKKTPILVMSARREAKDVQLSIQTGASDYIVKPVDPLVFAEKLNRLAGKADKWAEYSLESLPEMKVGAVQENIEILSLSEISITFRDTKKLAVGDSRRIHGAILDSEGLDSLQCVVRTSESEGSGKFKTSGTFVGLTETQMQKLRKICRKIWMEQQKAKGDS